MGDHYYVILEMSAGHAMVLYDAKKKENHSKPAMYQELFDGKGAKTTHSAFLQGFDQTRARILWSTARQIDDHRVIAAYYNEWDKKMGTATITLRNDRIQAQTQAQTQNQIPTWHIDPANGHGERGYQNVGG